MSSITVGLVLPILSILPILGDLVLNEVLFILSYRRMLYDFSFPPFVNGCSCES